MAVSFKTMITVVAMATVPAMPTVAQPDNPYGGRRRQSFGEFREGILTDYREFRQKLLDRYADFLEGEWHPYESFNGEKRDSHPKPRKVPRTKDSRRPKETKPIEDETGAKTSPVNPNPARTAPVQGNIEESAHDAVPQHKPVASTEPMTISERPCISTQDVDTFDFFEMPVEVPEIDFNISDKLYSNSDYAAQWRDFQKNEVADRVLPVLLSVADNAGLNDYLTYQLINFYIDSKFPDADVTSRMSAVHYLLANLGYDARMATTGNGVPLLLIPFRQTIYSRTYVMMGDRKYYVFEPEGFSLATAGPQQIMTCRLPDGAETGKRMDLVLSELRLPEKPRAFDFEYGPIHLNGEVNENLMPVLYHYPQMPVSDFANSNIQPELRNRLVEQLRSQLKDVPGDEAVGKLLEFMHNVFNYSTDEEFHGFEKPYFLEETLYYPKNDCEDRAIFYTYFLWNALGKPAQLVSFPGHEAATVSLDTPVEGTCYEYEGAIYYISDPTFIGSKTGMVMPAYRDITPKVDYTFK